METPVKRFFGIFLSVILMIGLMPGLSVQAYAASDPITYLDENGQEQTCTNYTVVTSETTTFADGGWYVVTDESLINSNRINVEGTAHLILADNAELSARDGINVVEGRALNVYAQSTDSSAGRLRADAATSGAAGIGGMQYGEEPANGGTITINGGIIEANGGHHAAGIGGGVKGTCEKVTINEGTVVARGCKATVNDYGGAGIGGGGNGGSGADVVINGGKVTAIGGGGKNTSAIGRGQEANVSVRNGSITLGENVYVKAGPSESEAVEIRDTTFWYHEESWVQVEAKYPVWIGGVQIDKHNAADVFNDGTVSYQPAENGNSAVLELNNYHYVGEGYNYDRVNIELLGYAALFSCQNLIINIKGDNTVMCTSNDSSTGEGIFAKDGNLSIMGTGTLFTSGNRQGVSIYARNGNITINGSNVTAGGNSSIGISTEQDYVEFNGGLVTAWGTDRAISARRVLVKDTMCINAGDDAPGIDATSTFEVDHLQKWMQVAESYPLWVGGTHVTIANKDNVLHDVNRSVRFAPKDRDNAATLTLNDADITTGYEENGETFAIYHTGNDPLNLLLHPGSENKVNRASNGSQGIKSSADLAISGGGKLSIKTTDGDGIAADRVTINEGEINVDVGGRGIASASKDVTIASGILNVSGNVGVDAARDINIGKNAPVVAKGSSQAMEGTVKNEVAGFGWINTEGSEGKAIVAINTEGQSLAPYKMVKFPAPEANVTTAPKAKALTYNGKAQKLVSAGKAKGGTLHFALGKDDVNVPTEGWSTTIPTKIASGTYYVWYKATGDINHIDSKAVCVKVTIAKKPEPLKTSGTLRAKMTAQGKTGMLFTWSKVNNVNGYDIFFSECNHDGKTYKAKYVKTVKGNKSFKWIKTKLKQGAAYKAYVKAYVITNGKKKYVRTSPMVHSFAGGFSGKYTNAKSIAVNKTKITLARGKSFVLKAKVVNLFKNKKLMSAGHVAPLRYMTTNSKVATVNSAGKITAHGKGSCTIYVYAHNGVFNQVEVVVS